MYSHRSFDNQDSKLFIAMCLCEQEKKNVMEMKDELLNSFSAPAIIQKRIDGLKLPIRFNDYALIATQCFAKVPGEAVLLLIDALTYCEGEEINMDRLTKLYPMGFYSKESLAKIIDDELKPRKRKWAEIY